MRINADITVTLHEYYDIEPLDPTNFDNADHYADEAVEIFKQKLEDTYPGQLDNDACMRIYLTDDYGDHRIEVGEVRDGHLGFTDEQFKDNWINHREDIIRYLREEEE